MAPMADMSKKMEVMSLAWKQALSIITLVWLVEEEVGSELFVLVACEVGLNHHISFEP